ASNRCTACTRRSRSGPRSSTRGRYPDRASSKAANSPAGPSPTTTGRWASGACPRGKRNCGGCLKQTQGEAPASAGSSPSSLSVTAMVYTSTGLPWRASTESLATPQRAARPGGTRRMRSACAPASASGSGQEIGRRILRTKSIGGFLCGGLAGGHLALDGVAARGEHAGGGRDLDGDGDRLLAHRQVDALAVDLRDAAGGRKALDLIGRAVDRDVVDHAGEDLDLVTAGLVDGADLGKVERRRSQVRGVETERDAGDIVDRDDARRQFHQAL